MDRRKFLFTSSGVLAAAVTGSNTTSAMHALVHQAPPLVSGGQDSLRVSAAGHRLLYGCAVNVNALRKDEQYARLIREQCSILVPENALKWSFLERTQGKLDFTDADDLVAFAEKNRIKMRGHTLVWHRSVPDWVTQQNAATLLREHIHTVLSRYAGRMHSWDVVNEAVEPKDGRADGLRKSKWLEYAGDGYIEAAFRAARMADPTALLTYNDYGLEEDTFEHEQRRLAVLLLLRRLRARNVPIDAVGIQSHLSARTGHSYGDGLRRFLASVRELGLQVFVTELDVNDSHLPNGAETRDREVAATTSKFLNVALADPGVRAVLTWGLTLRYTWLQKEHDNPGARGLPFDAEGVPTSMFGAIRDSFNARREIAEHDVPAGTYKPFRPRG